MIVGGMYNDGMRKVIRWYGECKMMVWAMYNDGMGNENDGIKNVK